MSGHGSELFNLSGLFPLGHALGMVGFWGGCSAVASYDMNVGDVCCIALAGLFRVLCINWEHPLTSWSVSPRGSLLCSLLVHVSCIVLCSLGLIVTEVLTPCALFRAWSTSASPENY